ncbi:MAG: septum site-determining protein MinC [Zoogloeaceae bacterium]|jgi:septum site-determining protein MinC|nr:septum site-determining protein MinC [Zoogloeaceae bacterium]
MCARPISQLIEFKGSTAPLIVVTIKSIDAGILRRAAETLFGGDNFFEGDAGLLNLAQLPMENGAPAADWPAVVACFARYGLRIIGVRGGHPDLEASAEAAGLVRFPADDRRSTVPEPAKAALETVSAPMESPPAANPEASTPATMPQGALVVERPLRSGQRIYARGRDLVTLSVVNPGAEVIADGSIHIYAPLRGRALAGASGLVEARIYTTSFEAELVSVAGVYRNFANGIPDEWARRPVVVRAKGAGIALERLKLD